MFSHIMVGTNDTAASKAFYDAIFAALGHGPGSSDDKGRAFWITEKGIFVITPPIDGNPATAANGSTIGFAASSPEMVDAWHEAGVSNGGTTCEDPPGIRESEIGKMYLAYLRDPAGNKLCALHRMG